MAVQSDTSRIQYAGNNSTTTSYAVPFVFQENAHLKAIARTSAGVESVVTLTNHTGAGNVNGGTVRTAVAVPATSTLTIYREVPATQTTTYAEGGDFPAASHERALDKLTQIAQQLKRNVESSVRMTDAVPLAPLVVPTGSTPHVLTTVNGAAPTWETVPSVSTALNIPSLTDASTVNGSDELIVQQSGLPRRATRNELMTFAATGSTSSRLINDRFADYLNVKDFGAVGNGVADDTAAINSAITAASGAGLYFPNGTYLFSGTVSSLFALRLSGGGLIRVDSYDYPAERKTAINHLWAGDLSAWPMGPAFNASTVQRVHVPAGCTFAREGLVGDALILQVNGDYNENAVRVRRTEATSSNAAANLVFNLTYTESKPLVGNSVVLQWNSAKGAGYTGTNVSWRIQYSVEPEQPILNADGTYTNGNVNAATGTFAPAASARNPNTLYWATAAIPSDATQVSVVFSIPFVGTAPAEDHVDFESVSLCVGSTPCDVIADPAQSALTKARTRFQSSYPSGLPRGSATRQGAVQAVAINANGSFAFTMPVDFAPTMAIAPQFFHQSPTSGTESRILNVTTGNNINGLAYNLSQNGATITNNGAVTANDRLLCHWTANTLF